LTNLGSACILILVNWIIDLKDGLPLQIMYANKRVGLLFDDYDEMKKKLPSEWVRTIKKHIDRLKAAECFEDFLKLNLGHPEPLKGKNKGAYSLHITGNVRMIIRPISQTTQISYCKEVEIEGVVDYHGSKESWYIS